MCKKNILTITAVAILALAIGQVQAETVTVPNSDFELIYKPGSTTITGELSPAGGSWTQGVGPDCPIGLEVGIEVGEYEFSDTSIGTVADIPGWLGYDRDGWIALGGTYGRNQTTGNLQGSVANQSNHTPGGLNCYLANGGGWSNPAGGLIVSDASLGNILSNSTYTLSMFVKARGGGADPIVLDLLLDGVVVTPSFSVSPVLTGDWQEFTRTYDVADLTSYVGQALTIVLGVGRNSSGDQSHFDDVSLSYYVALPPGQATNPNPADGATDVCPKVVLSWTPGAFVGALSPKHKVFLSENFDDVNDGVGGVTQDPNRYPATGTLSLDFGKTYYWKVDEANSTTGWDEGGIWQFTTEPIAYPIAGDKITAATASSLNSASEGPENTINGSGLDANDMHSAVTTDMWLSGSHQPGEAWIKYELDNVYKLHEMWVWNYNSGMEDVLGYGLEDVTIEYSENGTDYTTLGGTTHEFARAPGAPGYEHNTEVYFGVPAKYVKLTANSNWVGIFDNYGLSEVRFFRIPVRAREPSPEDGTTGVWPDVVLSWIPGRDADTHNLYLSTDEQAVTQGTISPSSIPAADGCRASYGPLSLEFGKTYYWRIDEVNDADTWKGDTWSFTTRKVYYVDDDGPADFDNIQAAIDEANGGDVIIVYPGRYCENINFSGKAITVTSTNPDAPNIVEGTVIDANGVGSVVTFANGEGPDSVLAGFTITGGYGTADTSIANFIYWGAGIYCNNASPTVKDNVIIGNYGPIKMEGDDPENWQLGYGGGIGCLQSSAIITRNIIKGNEAYAGAGIMVYVGDGRITDNLIYDNSAEIGGGVILLVGGQLINNTVVSNHATIAGNVYGGGEFLIVNNIISSGNAVEGGGIYTENPDQYVIAYNNVWDNTGGNYREVSDQTGLNGNISEAPLFVNPAGNDYHLQVDSPCINAGDPNYVAEPNETDLDGKPRVIGGRIDMGAYEFNHIPAACIVGGNRIVEAEAPWGARVTLDGSCSSDADSTPGTNEDIAHFDWYKVDACDPNFEDFLASGEIIDCNLPLGEHIIVLEVIDKAGAFDTNEVTIIVQDTTPPEFTLSVTPTTLWPANHKMVLITPSWTVSDICDASPEISLVSITMNEGDEAIGDGHTTDDIQIGDDGFIYLRAERSGTGSGRIYTITYQAVDDSGNAAVASATVTVPHDQR